jgi:hypothetical protein
MAVEPTHRNITDSLTERQRELVRQNLGLVAVHIRRHVGTPDSLAGGREWQELFQEGCLGLITAARAHRRSMATPFAAFALPRIRRAIARALEREERARRAARTLGRQQAGTPAPEPFEDDTSPVGAARASSREEGDRHDPHGAAAEPAARDTVGDRLRAKYERAVRYTGDALAARPLARDNHERIVRALVDGRYLIPSDECKRPLREIARGAGCSIMRVARCDRELHIALKRLLTSDPELATLRRIARTHPMGVAAVIDPALERELARSAGVEFASRVRRSAPSRRAAAMRDLLLEADVDLEKWTPRVFQKLPPAARERLLLERVGRRVPGVRMRRRRRKAAGRRHHSSVESV